MTYVFDIDGTICSLTNGDYENAKPFSDRIDRVNKLYDEGHTITFHTSSQMNQMIFVVELLVHQLINEVYSLMMIKPLLH